MRAQSSFLIILIVCLVKIYSACPAFDTPSITYSDLTCPNSKILTSSDFPSLPAEGTKQITMIFTISTVGVTCARGTNKAVFTMTLNIGGTETEILKLVDATSIDGVYFWNITDTTRTYMANRPLSGVTTARFAVQLDFNANTFKWIGNDGRPGSFGPVYTEGTAPNFGAWSIDNTLKFYINSGVGGADSTNFKVQNMKVKFGTYTLSGFEAEESGVEGSVIAYYKMTEGSGSTLTDSSGANFGTAYLGTSTAGTPDQSTTTSPSWDSGLLVFDQMTQYITMPVKPMCASQDDREFCTVGFSFWIKLTELIQQYDIFTTQNSGGAKVYNMYVNPGGLFPKLQNSYNGNPLTITAGSWNLMTIYYRQSENGVRGFSKLYVGSTVDGMRTEMEYSSMTSGVTDSSITSFKIGGFKGMIRDFKIYSGASPILNSPSCATGCDKDLGGFSSTCVVPTCTGGSLEASTCTCPTGTSFSAGECITTPTTPNNQIIEESSSLSGGAIAGIVVGSVVAVCAVLGATIYFHLRGKRKQGTKKTPAAYILSPTLP